jgi:hypothetical protein
MPSARYYRDQAKALLSWARVSKDRPYADRLRARAAEELEQAESAREAVDDLNSLLMEFNSQRLRTTHQHRTQMPRPEPVRGLQDLLALIGGRDEIAPRCGGLGIGSPQLSCPSLSNNRQSPAGFAPSIRT